jgi:hypothetical protein
MQNNASFIKIVKTNKAAQASNGKQQKPKHTGKQWTRNDTKRNMH